MRPNSHRNGIAHPLAVPVALAALAGLLAVPAYGHDPASPASAADASPPPLYDDLGTHHYPVATTSPEAQKYFDQGLRLAWGFNHEEARRAFHRAQELDPACVLCYWGEAYVLGPNINWPMPAEATAPALAALARAQALTPANDKEKGLVEALALRYSDAPDADRLAMDAAYADAMVKLSGEFPDDDEIAVLAAEALMDTQPWDYWQTDEAGAKAPKGRQAEINALLERTLAANPDHIGAIHLYIHLWEASDTPERAERYANRLAALAPGAGHLVHMGSHIYYRLGRFADAIHDNRRAAEVDETYMANGGNRFYADNYYLHNVHFVVTSAQMAGDADTVAETAGKLASIVTEEAAATYALVQPILAAPLFAHAQFSSPDEILMLADPGDSFPYVKGMWHYARGVAFARKRDLAAAAAEAEAIDKLVNEADLGFLTSFFVPADDLLQIARHVVLARIAQAKGYYGTAIDEFERAVALQDGIFYMEPPFWYYPVRQSLGAALLQAGRAEEAAEVFKAALEESPNNGWVIYGLKETQLKLGDADGAKASEAALARAWHGPADFLDLGKL